MSFYVVFGNKVGLFSCVFNEYVGTEVILFVDIFCDDCLVGECLVEVLKEVVCRYS